MCCYSQVVDECNKYYEETGRSPTTVLLGRKAYSIFLHTLASTVSIVNDCIPWVPTRALYVTTEVGRVLIKACPCLSPLDVVACDPDAAT